MRSGRQLYGVLKWNFYKITINIILYDVNIIVNLVVYWFFIEITFRCLSPYQKSFYSIYDSGSTRMLYLYKIDVLHLNTMLKKYIYIRIFGVSVNYIPKLKDVVSWLKIKTK